MGRWRTLCQSLGWGKYARREWHVYTEGDYFPRGKCLYFLFIGERLVYIGKSVDLRVRLRKHRKFGTPFDSVKYQEASDCDRLGSFEALTIRFFQPDLNTEHTDRYQRNGHSWAGFAMYRREPPPEPEPKPSKRKSHVTPTLHIPPGFTREQIERLGGAE